MGNLPAISEHEIGQYIYLIRGAKVMLDFHLAGLYGTETRVLKQQVRRNITRFPEDFMFELTNNEIDFLVSQNVIASKKVLGGAKPMAFTEQGVAMLSSVLKSDIAIDVNIAVMRTFVHARRLIETNKKLSEKVKALEKNYDEKFEVVFHLIDQLLDHPNPPRRKIGYKNANK